MPVARDGVSVAFHTTLLALIRTSLGIYTTGNSFENDKELRRVMQSIWPKDCQKYLNKLLPKTKGNDLQIIFYFYIEFKIPKKIYLYLITKICLF